MMPLTTSGFCDSSSTGIADRRILRLIRKWLNAGVLEDGELTKSVVGTPQGATVSPLLANVYLHYVFDLWANQWRKRHAQGDVIIVRYADDFVVGFQHKTDAVRFLADLRDRFRRFHLELHPQKTRLIEFGRFAAENRKRRGAGKPETFTFLGFTHMCGRTHQGKFLVMRHTAKKRLRATLQAVKLALRLRMHEPLPAQGAWVLRVPRGANQCPYSRAIPDRGNALLAADAAAPQSEEPDHLGADEATGGPLASSTANLASVARTAVLRHDPRQEPGAVVPHAGICAGGPG
jgi:RNA-directed DNA polymerase